MRPLPLNPPLPDLPRYINAAEQRIEQIARAARKAHRAGRDVEILALDRELVEHRSLLATYRNQHRHYQAEQLRRSQVAFDFNATEPAPPPAPQPLPDPQPAPQEAAPEPDPLAAEWADYAAWRSSGKWAEAIAIEYGEACRLPHAA
jgi:hypothetical protein